MVEFAPSPLAARPNDKRVRRPAEFHVRRITAHLRATPEFLVIGEMKCATSSFFKTLCTHPQILPPYRKETHFFTEGFERGRLWYRAHFPMRSAKAQITGEATPGYLFDLDSPQRIASLLPDARFIVLLRDPVERAISHYHHEVRMGRETLGMAEAFAAEDARIEAAKGTAAERETRLHASYLGRGRYASSLRRWFAHFDHDRFHIIETIGLRRDPLGTIEAAADFLNLDRRTSTIPEQKSNTGGYTPPPEPFLQNLRSRFREENEDLAEILGRKPSWAH